MITESSSFTVLVYFPPQPSGDHPNGCKQQEAWRPLLHLGMCHILMPDLWILVQDLYLINSVVGFHGCLFVWFVCLCVYLFVCLLGEQGLPVCCGLFYIKYIYNNCLQCKGPDVRIWTIPTSASFLGLCCARIDAVNPELITQGIGKLICERLAWPYCVGLSVLLFPDFTGMFINDISAV